MKSIDLNADLGEGMPWDIELLAWISSANVSCGAHAGNPVSIAATLAEADRRGVVVGAHPSWPDREGFGRRERTATAEEIESMIVEQVGSLATLGATIRYLKPHGALYNQAMRDDEASRPVRDGLIRAACLLGLPLLGLPATALEREAGANGLAFHAEGFPDRGYRPDGRLIPRSEPGAMIESTEDVVEGTARLATIGVESLCLHGDSAGAVIRAAAIRQRLEQEGWRIGPFAGAGGR